MKMSRHDRKIFNQGKAAGFAEGYAKGLYDGNPFNKIMEAVQEMADNITKTFSDPELIKALEEARQMQAECGCDCSECECNGNCDECIRARLDDGEGLEYD